MALSVVNANSAGLAANSASFALTGSTNTSRAIGVLTSTNTNSPSPSASDNVDTGNYTNVLSQTTFNYYTFFKACNVSGSNPTVTVSQSGANLVGTDGALIGGFSFTPTVDTVITQFYNTGTNTNTVNVTGITTNFPNEILLAQIVVASGQQPATVSGWTSLAGNSFYVICPNANTSNTFAFTITGSPTTWALAILGIYDAPPPPFGGGICVTA